MTRIGPNVIKKILTVFAECQVTTQDELGQKTGISRSGVIEGLALLKKHRLIREEDIPGSRGKKSYKLTAKAKPVVLAGEHGIDELAKTIRDVERHVGQTTCRSSKVAPTKDLRPQSGADSANVRDLILTYSNKAQNPTGKGLPSELEALSVLDLFDLIDSCQNTFGVLELKRVFTFVQKRCKRKSATPGKSTSDKPRSGSFPDHWLRLLDSVSQLFTRYPALTPQDRTWEFARAYAHYIQHECNTDMEPSLQRRLVGVTRNRETFEHDDTQYYRHLRKARVLADISAAYYEDFVTVIGQWYEKRAVKYVLVATPDKLYGDKARWKYCEWAQDNNRQWVPALFPDHDPHLEVQNFCATDAQVRHFTRLLLDQFGILKRYSYSPVTFEAVPILDENRWESTWELVHAGVIPQAFAESGFNGLAPGYEHRLYAAYREDVVKQGARYSGNTHPVPFLDFLRAHYGPAPLPSEPVSVEKPHPPAHPTPEEHQSLEAQAQEAIPETPVSAPSGQTPPDPNQESGRIAPNPSGSLEERAARFDINGYLRGHFEEVEEHGDELLLHCLDAACAGGDKHFYWNTQKRVGVCHKCNTTYRPIQVVVKHRELGWVEAMQWMAANPNTSPRIEAPKPQAQEPQSEIVRVPNVGHIDLPPFAEPITAGSAAEAYLTGRGFGRDVIDHFGLLFCPTGPRFNRIIAPIHFEERLVAYQCRDISGKSECKYLNPVYQVGDRVRVTRGEYEGYAGVIKGYEEYGLIRVELRSCKGRMLSAPVSKPFKKTDLWNLTLRDGERETSYSSFFYNWDSALAFLRESGCREIILVEGVTDVWRLWLHGYQNVVATLGKSLKPFQKYLLLSTWEVETIVLMWDRDALRASVQLAAELAASKLVKIALLEEGDKDPDTCKDIEKALSTTRTITWNTLSEEQKEHLRWWKPKMAA